MRFSTIPFALAQTLLTALPVMSAFTPPTGSLSLPSKIVTSSDGLQIFTESAGKEGAPAVIFLHALASTSAAFDPLFADPNLTSNLFMIRYDTRGHGRTGGPDDAEGYVSKLYADDFAAVAAAYGVTKPFYAGWSISGAVAADLVANNVPISGIIWLAPLPFFDLLPLVTTDLLRSFVPGLTNVNDSALALSTRIEFSKTLVAESILPEVPFSDLLSFIGSATFLPPNRASFVTSRTQDPGPLKEAAKQGLPLLLIHGNADLLVDPQEVLDRAVRPFFTNAEERLLDGIGHTPFYEAEKELLDGVEHAPFYETEEVAGFILGLVSRISPARHD